MIAASAALFALAAFLLFGIVTDRQHKRRFGRRVAPHIAARCRLVAWILVFACLVSAIAAWGWGVGPIGWTGLVMAGAGSSFLLLNFLPLGADRCR